MAPGASRLVLLIAIAAYACVAHAVKQGPDAAAVVSGMLSHRKLAHRSGPAPGSLPAVVRAVPGPVFPSGTTINGSFTLAALPGISFFDPPGSDPQYSVPDGFGNSVSADNVEITDGIEFVSIMFPAICTSGNITVDVTPAGLVTYSVQWRATSTCQTQQSATLISLTSAAFAGCTLNDGLDSTFPAPEQTVTGTLVDSTLQLAAQRLASPLNLIGEAVYTTSWQLSDCPAFVTTPCIGECCANITTLATRGTPCRAAASPCQQEAVCDGENPTCPPNPPVSKPTHCPWRPRGYTYDSTESDDATTTQEQTQVIRVSAQAAAAWDRANPDYDREWPECVGQCIDGVCALSFASPRCCYLPSAPHGDYYYHGGEDRDTYDGHPYSSDAEPAELGAAGSDGTGAQVMGGYWAGKDFWCRR